MQEIKKYLFFDPDKYGNLMRFMHCSVYFMFYWTHLIVFFIPMRARNTHIIIQLIWLMQSAECWYVHKLISCGSLLAYDLNTELKGTSGASK
jgi:hypothetical protein